VKVGSAQIRLAWDIPANVSKISQYLGLAHLQGVAILNFPEASLTGYRFQAFKDIDQGEIESGLDRLQKKVEETGVAAVVGTPFWEGRSLFNSVVVLFPDQPRSVYHKHHLVSFEESVFTSGTHPLVFKREGAVFGTLICRDQNFPFLASQMKELGAQVLFISCAHYHSPMEARWKVDKNRALPIARACENRVFVFKANAVGTVPGMISLGGSLIVGPNGLVITMADQTAEQLLVYDIIPSDFQCSW